VRPFKGIICADISEFESYHPSHAVGSLWAMYSGVPEGPSALQTTLLSCVRPARIDLERRVLDESRRGAGCGADRNNGFSSEMDAPAWPTARRGVRETSPQLRRS
jgi:hypothetical protein